MRTSVPSSHEERRKRREKEQNMWTDYSNFLSGKHMDVDTVGNDLPTLVRRIGTHPEDIYLEQSIYISKNDI